MERELLYYSKENGSIRTGPDIIYFEQCSGKLYSSACHMLTYHSTSNTRACVQHAHRSGPHKLAVRLLLYHGCHKVESSRAAGSV